MKIILMLIIALSSFQFNPVAIADPADYCNPFPDCLLWPPVAVQEINTSEGIMELEELLKGIDLKSLKGINDELEKAIALPNDIRAPFIFNEVPENQQSS